MLRVSQTPSTFNTSDATTIEWTEEHAGRRVIDITVASSGQTLVTFRSDNSRSTTQHHLPADVIQEMARAFVHADQVLKRRAEQDEARGDDALRDLMRSPLAHDLAKKLDTLNGEPGEAEAA